MILDGLKLTTYFGERDRTGGRLLADALFDLYERHRVQTSVLLRGLEGFGIKHALRTDRLLSLSEDLPVVSVAVDTPARIEQLQGDLQKLDHPGLITLERARLISGPVGAAAVAGELEAAAKLTIYVGRQERSARRPAFVAVCELLRAQGIAGATVLLGVDGTSHGRRERARFFAGNANVPLMIISIAAAQQIAEVLPRLDALLEQPVITLEAVRICKRDGKLLEPPAPTSASDATGGDGWQKLMVHASEAARVDGHPLHRVLVQRLRARGLSGATTVRGIWGFHGEHPPHGDKLLQLHRHVPTVTTVIDRPERIGEAFAIVDAVTAERGLVTSEVVPHLFSEMSR